MALPIGLHVVAPDAPGLIAGIAEADRLGLGTAWLTVGGAAPDPFAVFAAAARDAERIGFGTSIVPTFPRHPITMAQGAMTVDQLAPGRLRLGVGPSHRPAIEGTWGIPFRKPLGHLREYVAILRQLLEEGEANFDGEHLAAHARIARPTAVRVLISALRGGSFRLSGELTDGAISWMCPLPYLRDAAAPPVDGIPPRRLLALGIAAMLPIAAAGAIAWQLLEDQLRSPTAAAAFLLATGLILIAAERRLASVQTSGAAANGPASPSGTGLASLTLAKAAAIGIAQAIAVLPGVSRSGMCISAAISLGANRETATRFAFWLAIPALAGAGLLALYDVVQNSASADPAALAIGAATAFLSALLSIRALLYIAKAATLAPFALYCLTAGSAILLARAAGA